MNRNYQPSGASQGAVIAVLLALFIIVIVYTLAMRRDRCPPAPSTTRDTYMTGHYVFPQTSSAGYSYTEDPYPLQDCENLYPRTLVPARGSGYVSNWWPYRYGMVAAKEGMYRSPFDDPVEKAKYGDRRPLCLELAGQTGEGLPYAFDSRNLYYGGEFGWRNSFYY